MYAGLVAFCILGCHSGSGDLNEYGISPPPSQKCVILRKSCKPIYIGWFHSLTTLNLLLRMYACIYERLKLGYLLMRESLLLLCLSGDSFCMFLRPLTVLIPKSIYRCNIIHPLVRNHGRSRQSPAPYSLTYARHSHIAITVLSKALPTHLKSGLNSGELIS